MENHGDGGESHPTTKNLLIFPTRKIPLNKFTSSTTKIVIPSPSNSNFHLINLCKLHLWLQPLLLYHFFNFRLHVHMCCANFDKSMFTECCLQHDKSIEWSKFSGAKFPFCSLFNASWRTLIFLILVFLFSHFFFFISNFIKFQLTPLQLGLCGL